MSIIVRSNDPAADAKVNAPEAKTEVADAGSSQATNSAPEAEKASGQNESSESETEGKEDKEETESESEGSESDEETETKDDVKDDSKDEKPKKKGGFQRRIDKLSARNAQAQAELEYWKQQALKGASEPKPALNADPKTSSASDDGKPKADHFDTHAEFVEALTDWKVDQKEKANGQKAERAKQEASQRELVKTHVERVNAFKAKTEDFDDVLESVDDILAPAAVLESIRDSEHGPELMYELAKNRDEYARICKLSPNAAAREMGKLELKIASKSSPEKKTETKKITQAPKPLVPVGTGGKGSVSKTITDPNLSQTEYERLRREQIKKRRQV